MRWGRLGLSRRIYHDWGVFADAHDDPIPLCLRLSMSLGDKGHHESPVVALVGACSPSPKGDQPGSSGPPPGVELGPQIDWQHPLHGGITVATGAAAASYVVFKVVDPGIGTPTLVQVDDPSQVDLASRIVAFVYDLPNYGTVNVEEQEATLGTDQNLIARANAFTTTPSPDALAAQFHMVPLGPAKPFSFPSERRGLWIGCREVSSSRSRGQPLLQTRPRPLSAIMEFPSLRPIRVK
jgi:hypothetical protein